MLAAIFRISAIAFSLSSSGTGDEHVIKKHLRWVGTGAGLRLLLLSFPLFFGLTLVYSFPFWIVVSCYLSMVLLVSDFLLCLGGCRVAFVVVRPEKLALVV